MTVQTVFDTILGQAGVLVVLLLFAWLWMSGRIVSDHELKRTVEGYEREKTQLREERDHARTEAVEWKYMAMRGTDLATYLGEKATA